MLTLPLLATLGLVAYHTTAEPKWQLKFENSTYTGDGDPPEIWVKKFDPVQEGIITANEDARFIQIGQMNGDWNGDWIVKNSDSEEAPLLRTAFTVIPAELTFLHFWIQHLILLLLSL